MSITSDHEEIQACLKNVVDKFLEFHDHSDSTRCLQNLHHLKFANVFEQKIYNLLVSYAIKAEAISPGGIEGFVIGLKNEKDSLILPEKFNKQKLKHIISTFLSGVSDQLLIDCFNMTGLWGKIILSQHPVNGDLDFAEVNNGCFFKDFIPAFEIKSTKFLNPKIICIDGFIESVSEIHRLLLDASEQKETIILFVRGLSEEVKHTLKINYDRGSLGVIPVVVKYDLEGVNLLNDIAMINNGDVISSLKGQLIGSIDLSTVSRVESVDITSSGVLIENSITSNIIDLHIKRLQEKIINSTNQYEIDALTKRIQNLGAHRVTIRLKNDEHKKEKSLRVDRTLRAIKSATTHGVCCFNDKNYPYAGIKAGVFFSKKFKDSINELGAIIS